MSTTKKSGQRSKPRTMLALIALATDLPVPRSIYLYDDSGILSMRLNRIADGQMWSTFLGGQTDTYVNNGVVYLNEGVIKWHGWSVHLHATEDAPRPDAPLDQDTAAQLQAVATGGTPAGQGASGQ